MIDKDVTQQPRLTQPGYTTYFTSAKELADSLQELVDALRRLGDIDLCPTSVRLNLNVSQSQGKHRARCATVDDLCRALGLPATLQPCADWWSYGTTTGGRSVHVFTDACSAEEYAEARREAGWRGRAAAARVDGTNPCEGEWVVDETGAKVPGCPAHVGMLAGSLTAEELAKLNPLAAEAEQIIAAAQAAASVEPGSTERSTDSADRPRCEAAHTDDPSPCEGDPDAVRVMDQTGAEALGCVHHGAVLLASMDGGQVSLGPRAFVGAGTPPGAAIDVYNRARQLRPFAFQHHGGERVEAGERR